MRRRKRTGHGDDRENGIAEAHARLVEHGIVMPVGEDAAEQQAWSDCDLASLAENRLGEHLDPFHLNEARRADCTRRAVTERLSLPRERDGDRCYWLVDDGERVGTVALASASLGGRFVRLSSLYVLPRCRGRGVARMAIALARDALGEQGWGLKLDTSWTWQSALRFYLGIGMWVRMWKRELDLWCEAGVATPVIEIGDVEASLSGDVEGDRTVLVRARRDGDRLVSFVANFRDRAPEDERLAAVAWDASSTLAVALATRGWPLLESPDAWRPRWEGDGGSPEGLAYRIVCWEAWANAHGFRVETPRVPGLSYPTWEELNAD